MKTLNAGLDEVSPDHNAILGPVPDLPRFVLANGFPGHGMQHAPGGGKGDLRRDRGRGVADAEISALSVARFGEGWGFRGATSSGGGGPGLTGHGRYAFPTHVTQPGSVDDRDCPVDYPAFFGGTGTYTFLRGYRARRRGSNVS